MNKELEIWQFAAERLKRDESVMLLIVAQSSGSSPGRQGFKMIVAKDKMCGSIGGGVMEINLVEVAKKQLYLVETQTFVSYQVHRKKSPAASGMICSGRQFVIFFRLNPFHLEEVMKIINALEKFQSKILHIKANRIKRKNEFLVYDSTDKILLEEWANKSGFDFLAKDHITVYKEKIGFKNKLFIIGGGHCALALSELMSKMDFHISLFDDRADLNTLAKNKFVHDKTVIESYENIDAFIPSGANVYVVVMTLGYKFDETVVRKLFDKEFSYFGVLGSKRKMAVLLKNLEKENFNAEKLKQIHTPIGLPINSRTPEEIAVSIVAEIISVKNSKQTFS